MKVAMVMQSMPDSYDALIPALESRSEAELTMVKRKSLDEAQKRLEKIRPSEALLRTALNETGRKTVWNSCGKPGHFKRNCP